MVATPCPLILAVPVAIVAGMSRCARHSVLIKNGAALEAMARATTLLIDKTGTLTGGVPRIREVEALPPFSEQEVLHCAASLAQSSPHVMSASLVRDAVERGGQLSVPHAVREDHGAGLSGVVDGREVVLGGHAYVLAHVAPAAGEEAMPTARALAGGSHHFRGPRRPARRMDRHGRRAPRGGRRRAFDLRKAGITRIVLVTGDREAIARSVAERPADR